MSGTYSTALPSPWTCTAPVGPSPVCIDLPCWCVFNVRLMCNVPGRYACSELQAELTVSICVCQMCVIKESIVLLSKSLLSLSLLYSLSLSLSVCFSFLQSVTPMSQHLTWHTHTHTNISLHVYKLIYNVRQHGVAKHAVILMNPMETF